MNSLVDLDICRPNSSFQDVNHWTTYTEICF